MNLEDIGFYTLSEERCKSASATSPLQRCELIVTDRCNFKCPYCRGLRSELRGDIDPDTAWKTVINWGFAGLRNIRFSGGEPTLYKHILHLVDIARAFDMKRIAVSTNGSADPALYKLLIDTGVNDFSISLDGGCCAVGDKMAGTYDSWRRVVGNIRLLSSLTYVSVGMVFTEANVDQCVEAVEFATSLGVSDIRVIPSAQYNKSLSRLATLPATLLDRFPVLKYRINNIQAGRKVRGLHHVKGRYRCYLGLDDMAVAGKWHFPCIIHMREGGKPVGVMGPGFREERAAWVESHDPLTDPICLNNCLDVCCDYNIKARDYRNV